MAGDSASMPTQQGVGCDEPAGSVPSRQGRRDRTEQGPVLIGEGWSAVLAVQDCELVAQHDDLKVLRASQTHRQACQRHEQPIQNATHRTPGCNRTMPRQRTRPHFGHPHVDLSLCGPMLSPRVPHHVPIPGPRMERETPGQRLRPNYGHPQGGLRRDSTTRRQSSGSWNRVLSLTGYCAGSGGPCLGQRDSRTETGPPQEAGSHPSRQFVGPEPRGPTRMTIRGAAESTH